MATACDRLVWLCITRRYSSGFDFWSDLSGRMCGNSITSRIDCRIFEHWHSSFSVEACGCFIPSCAFCYPAKVMSSDLDQVTVKAMKLPLRERVLLAQRLVSTIDDGVEPDTEALWFAEAERRLEELRSGKVQGIASDNAFITAREALKK